MFLYEIFQTVFLKDLTWQKSANLVFIIQKRLLKAAYVSDKKKLQELQKLLLQSNCARLLAIRDVTQVSSNKKVSGIDGKISLSFSERFELNEYLKFNLNNWKFQSLKEKVILTINENSIVKKIPTIADRVWQVLIKFALEPVHEATFHPFNYGFRFNRSFYEMQEAIILNLSKNSLGKHKRILKLDLPYNLSKFNYDYLMRSLIAPRSIKLGIFRLLEKGFNLEFPEENFSNSTFSSLLLNILFNGIENLHNCVRYGHLILFFLRPKDDEKYLLYQIFLFISKIGLDFPFPKFTLFSFLKGFDFLEWHFKFSRKNSNGLYVLPSFYSYQNFLKRVKRIVNNSNYGSTIKATKLYPIIKKWKEYHKYSDLISLSYSLFFVRKRAFKAFNSESRQDFYSSNQLLNKCFFVSDVLNKEHKSSNFNLIDLSNFGHLVFLFEYPHLNSKKNFHLCVHCGVSCL